MVTVEYSDALSTLTGAMAFRFRRALVTFLCLCSVRTTYARDLTLEDGHMQPFGTGRPSYPIEEVVNFPSPKTFFDDYMLPLKPLKMKGAAKYSEGFYKWTDDFFLGLDGQDTEINVETVKKESRQQQVINMKFKEFVESYNTSGRYMVDSVPKNIRKDVILPCPIQCKSLFVNNLVDNVMWFSSGGTSSVVHTDSVNNINCLFRGKKRLIMVDPDKYGDKVDLDRPEGSYSAVDVDKVDYLKYPGLADVEYYHVDLEAGDCLFIPYKWIHQVRSFGSNLAVNIWWKYHLGENVNVEECNDPCDPDLTLEEVDFTGFGQVLEDAVEIKQHMISFLGPTKSIDFKKFCRVFIGAEFEIIMKTKGDHQKELIKSLFTMYSMMDLDKDGNVTEEEIEKTDSKVFSEMTGYIKDVEELMDLVYEELQDALEGNGEADDEYPEVKDEL